MNIKLDDLEINNYKIYQDRDAFCFGIDSILLANFFLMNIGKTESDIKICDLCSGNNIIPILIYAKRKMYNLNSIHITSFEIDKDQTEISKKSIELNEKIDSDIASNIHIYNDDINNILLNKEKYKFLYNSFDAITVNPPYIKKEDGEYNESDKLKLAKHEITVNIEDIIKISKVLLKSNRKLFMVHRTERLTEIIDLLNKNDFNVKTIQFIHSKIDNASNLFLIIAVKGGKVGVKVLEPIVVFDENNKYTDKINKIYGKI